jgi:hypothetical protein
LRAQASEVWRRSIIAVRARGKPAAHPAAPSHRHNPA